MSWKVTRFYVGKFNNSKYYVFDVKKRKTHFNAHFNIICIIYISALKSYGKGNKALHFERIKAHMQTYEALYICGIILC